MLVYEISRLYSDIRARRQGRPNRFQTRVDWSCPSASARGSVDQPFHSVREPRSARQADQKVQTENRNRHFSCTRALPAWTPPPIELGGGHTQNQRPISMAPSMQPSVSGLPGGPLPCLVSQVFAAHTGKSWQSHCLIRHRSGGHCFFGTVGFYYLVV